MSRSIEVGRAVLCSPATNLELWLTTLITISPLDNEIDMQQLKPTQILEVLSSGDVWIRRAAGMHAKMYLTLQDEPLPSNQLQGLVEALIRAPAWEQLMLQPSLPMNAVHETGVIRLDIKHTDGGGPQEGSQRHRVFSNVPFMDIKPPEDIKTFAFESVHFSMHLLDPRPRGRGRHKRAKAASGSNETLISTITIPQKIEEDQSGMIQDAFSRSDTDESSANCLHSTQTQPIERKAKTPTNKRKPPSPSCTIERYSSSRKQSTTSPNLQCQEPAMFDLSSSESIKSVIDGALKISIFGNLNGRSAHGLRVKANTFHFGLAEIAPALWRPGYLNALSQRVHLLKTVGHSINQIAYVRANSLRLKEKTHKLESPSNLNNVEAIQGKDVFTHQKIKRPISSIEGRLWSLLQKSLGNRSMTSLQTFLPSDEQAVDPNLDDMLEEVI